MNKNIAIHWFRRDLRLDDNTALYHALKQHDQVLCVFIFDTDILDKLEEKNDARVNFIYNRILELDNDLSELGTALIVEHGKPVDVWKKIIDDYPVKAVYTNHDYEPYALDRDEKIKKLLAERGISFHTYKDQVIFEKNEVIKDDGSPYTVFTPYSRNWKEKITEPDYQSLSIKKYTGHFLKSDSDKIISLKEIGFEKSNIQLPPSKINTSLIVKYDDTRDIPSIPGTSRLGIHLRFGTISIRKLIKQAAELNEKFVTELIWREFYQMVLWFFPYVVDSCFKKQYNNISWRNNEREFFLWCNGKTGYPLVDAGMRELNTTGWMHNRVRMVTASFLTKHLLIDWRWGEAYFAGKLLDYELASNNGGWQWAAGTGVDAAPYFRIFNPAEQAKKFDPELKYIRKWVPEIDELTYPQPIVDHKFARERALKTYRAADTLNR